MSGDLISRTAVIQYLQEQKENVTKENEKNRFVPAQVCEGMMIALEAFGSFIKQSNIVYDVEKVIQQITELQLKVKDKLLEVEDEEYAVMLRGQLRGIADCLEIVKKGGV